VGFLVASLLESPTKVLGKDGQPIVLDLPKTWREELMSLPRSIMTPSVLLTSIALFSCQMVFSLTSSLNAFHYNARTRALVNVSHLCSDGTRRLLTRSQFCFWLSSAIGSVGFGFVFDSKWLGHRRRRSMVAAALVAALLIGPHSGVLFFLATNSQNRHKAPLGIDWNDGSAFLNLLVIYIFVGFSSYVF
jgi:hypothetical protein